MQCNMSLVSQAMVRLKPHFSRQAQRRVGFGRAGFTIQTLRYAKRPYDQ